MRPRVHFTLKASAILERILSVRVAGLPIERMGAGTQRPRGGTRSIQGSNVLSGSMDGGLSLPRARCRIGALTGPTSAAGCAPAL